jgi:hypothetical protein
MLQIILPVSLVLRSIDMRVDPVTVGLIVLPLAIEDVSVDMPKLSLAMSLVVLPLTFVAGSIGPDLDSAPMPDCPPPLTLVHSSVFKAVLIPVLEWQTLSVVESVIILIILKILMRHVVRLSPISSLSMAIMMLIVGCGRFHSTLGSIAHSTPLISCCGLIKRVVVDH